MRTMLKGKIHRAIVTDVNVDYEGSITIDPVLMEAADIVPFEQVHVVNINNAARFETYAIEGEPGSGQVCLNGAAARLAARGDKVIILTYCHLSDEEVRKHTPRIAFVDSLNHLSRHEEDRDLERGHTEGLIRSLSSLA